jgi:hypothetical protein
MSQDPGGSTGGDGRAPRDAASAGRPSSDRYHGGSDRYQGGLNEPAPPRSGAAQLPTSRPEAADEGEPLFGWTRDEYPSLEAFIDRILEERAKVQGEWDAPKPRPSVPTPSLPGAELADINRSASEMTASRPLGIRLRHSDYEQLACAAELYGVAPSTLARMLVGRGARAILDREPGPKSG